jgi:hypothetical protein
MISGYGVGYGLSKKIISIIQMFQTGLSDFYSKVTANLVQSSVNELQKYFAAMSIQFKFISSRGCSGLV